MKKIIYPLATVLLLAAAACSEDDGNKPDEPTPPVPEEPAEPAVTIDLSAAERAAVKRANSVGEEMFRALCADPDNAGKTVAFSPMAANVLLSAVSRLNVDASPAADISSIYGSTDDLDAAYSEIRAKVAALDENVDVSFVGGLWCDRDFYDNKVSASLKEGSGFDAKVIDANQDVIVMLSSWLGAHGILASPTTFDIATPVLASVLKIKAVWGESTTEFGEGLLFAYREKSKVREGKNSYSVAVPLGKTGCYELMVVKAKSGADIGEVIASGEVFDPGNGRYALKPFTVAIPGDLGVDVELSFDSAIHAVLVKYIPDYESINISPLEGAFNFYALGNLSLDRTGVSAGGASVGAGMSRAAAADFINIADGNCVIFINETSTKTCLYAARIPAL